MYPDDYTDVSQRLRPAFGDPTKSVNAFTYQTHLGQYPIAQSADATDSLSLIEPVETVEKETIMASDERLERTIRKALRDSAALPTSAITYDPPDDPELRDAYDEIFWLASREYSVEHHPE